MILSNANPKETPPVHARQETTHDLSPGVPQDHRLTHTASDLPNGTKVVSAEAYGYSACTTTGRTSIVRPDGSPKRWFLKDSRIIKTRGELDASFTPLISVDADTYKPVRFLHLFSSSLAHFMQYVVRNI